MKNTNESTISRSILMVIREKVEESIEEGTKKKVGVVIKEKVEGVIKAGIMLDTIKGIRERKR